MADETARRDASAEALLLRRVESAQDAQAEASLLNGIPADLNLQLKVLSHCRHAHPRIVHDLVQALLTQGV